MTADNDNDERDDSNELATITNAAVPAPSHDTEGLRRLATFAASTKRNVVEGAEVRFVDGDWLRKAQSDDEKDVEFNTNMQLIARCDLLTWCWTQWAAKRPVGRKFGSWMESEPPARGELGDNDRELWETDPRTNAPADPWTLTLYPPLQAGNGERFVFTTQTAGGRGALGDLVGAYVSHVFDGGADEHPVVELRADRFFSKKFGRWIPKPQLDIVRWGKVAPPRGDMDDEIPF